MEIRYFDPSEDGFYGAYYPCQTESASAFIYMLGPSVDNFLVKLGVRWLHRLGCNVLAMSPEPKDRGFHNLPLERFGAAISWLKKNGNVRVGIGGGSATAMLALLAASYYPDITLTLAMTPCDFVMEGYYRDKLDGVGERPGSNESTAAWQGKPLPYLPFAYRHPEYWKKLQEESKAGGNMIASREMFQRSEELHPLQEEEYIPVERIRGTIVFAGAEDDCLWDTCRYIRRMEQRLEQHASPARYVSLLYEHGTHFLFPQSMLQMTLHGLSGLPVYMFRAGRINPKACKESRLDFDRRVQAEILRWMEK